MTGVEVLVIVQSKRERKIWASELLKKEYEDGKLAPKGKGEFADVASTVQAEEDESLGVAPLESTPDKLPLDKNLSELFGHDIQGAGVSPNIPPSLREVLVRRPLPHLTTQEQALRLPQPGPQQTGPQHPGISFISDDSITLLVNARKL